MSPSIKRVRVCTKNIHPDNGPNLWGDWKRIVQITIDTGAPEHAQLWLVTGKAGDMTVVDDATVNQILRDDFVRNGWTEVFENNHSMKV